MADLDEGITCCHAERQIPEVSTEALRNHLQGGVSLGKDPDWSFQTLTEKKDNPESDCGQLDRKQGHREKTLVSLTKPRPHVTTTLSAYAHICQRPRRNSQSSQDPFPTMIVLV